MNNTAQIEPYTLLRASLALFNTPPAQLDAPQLQQARLQAVKEYELESRVLHSPEAARVVIGEQEAQDAFRQIRDRYADEDEFRADLHRNHLDIEQLRRALQRECRVNATLALIGSRAPKISDVEIGIYYHSHPDKFVRPERREVRHILITINDAYAENSRDSAMAKIAGIHAKLCKKPHKFAELAMQNSECPTALQGGLLGTVARGKLYPQLDGVLFQMQEGQISGIIETEIGLHILSCERIYRSENISLKNAAPKIRALMEERYRRVCQRAWLAGLSKSNRKESSHE
ncbi:MAG: nitrogen fixation protein NifM [Gammaproteobacteria bacterium]